MKHRLILIFHFLTFISLFSQNQQKKVYVEYELRKGNTLSKEYLIATSKNALYTSGYQDIKTDGGDENNFTDSDYVVPQERVKLNQMKYYSTLNSNKLYFISIFPKTKKTIVALDQLPDMKWDLSSKETKRINSFECKKATLIYRGSKVEAFYTTDIPISFGPFKFKGLPGLILELYNIDHFGTRYKWTAKKIQYPHQNNVNIEFLEEDYKGQIVAYEHLITSFDRKMTNFSKRMTSRNQRGAKTQLINRGRMGIEKVYEWEEQKN